MQNMNIKEKMEKEGIVLNVSELPQEIINVESVTNKILFGECLEALKKLPSNSIDTLITDPPAGINFMGKEFDRDRGGRDKWIAWLQEIMEECYRVLKPGSTALVWAIPRTSHWTATAVENAGFKIKNIIMHIFGSGFPKSHNVGKSTNRKEWEGYGTDLKPAAEHWILAMKPNQGTYANNALRWGVSGLNIDGGRIEGDMGKDRALGKPRRTDNDKYGKSNETINPQSLLGRFPANIILDEEAAKMLDEQSGELSKAGNKIPSPASKGMFGVGGEKFRNIHNDKGGASRFFKVIK